MNVYLIFKKLFLPLFIFLISFIICDLLFSNFIYKQKIKLRYDCFEYEYYDYKSTTYYNYYLDKNCTAIEKQRTVMPYKVLTDHNGYRYSGKERFPKKSNIVFLGDSFTYGYGVKYEDSFPGILENMDFNYNIYNLGVPGYGMQKYYYMLSDFLKNNKAEKIFLTMDMTDVGDASSTWTFISNNKFPVIKSLKINVEIDNWSKFKNSNFKGTKLITFHLRNFLRYLKIKHKSNESTLDDAALYTTIANFTYSDINSHTTFTQKSFSKGLEIIDIYFNKITELANENNSEVYLVIFPWPENLIYGQKIFNWENFSRNLCLKNNCTKVINLFSDFENIKKNKINWKNTIYIKDDVHFKKFGNQLVANKIIDILN